MDVLFNRCLCTRVCLIATQSFEERMKNSPTVKALTEVLCIKMKKRMPAVTTNLHLTAWAGDDIFGSNPVNDRQRPKQVLFRVCDFSCNLFYFLHWKDPDRSHAPHLSEDDTLVSGVIRWTVLECWCIRTMQCCTMLHAESTRGAVPRSINTHLGHLLSETCCKYIHTFMFSCTVI